MSLGAARVVLGSLSLLVSATTAWLTLLRRGTVRMTRPALIVFQDAASKVDGPKVWMRMLLYSTARRGNVVESMFVRLRREKQQDDFTVWGYGERSDLVRGSGLFIEHTGVGLNHHFSLAGAETDFTFAADDYTIDVLACEVHRRAPVSLATIPLHLTDDQASALKRGDGMVLFEWLPETERYEAHIRDRPRE